VPEIVKKKEYGPSLHDEKMTDEERKEYETKEFKKDRKKYIKNKESVHDELAPKPDSMRDKKNEKNKALKAIKKEKEENDMETIDEYESGNTFKDILNKRDSYKEKKRWRKKN